LLLFCVAHSSCFDFGESDSVLRGARYGFHCLVLISHVSCLLFAGRRFGLPPSRLIFALPVLAVRVFPLLSIAPRSGFHFLSSSVSTRSRAPVPFPGSMFPLEDFLFWFHAAGFLDPSCLWCPAQESFFCSVLVSSARADVPNFILAAGSPASVRSRAKRLGSFSRSANWEIFVSRSRFWSCCPNLEFPGFHVEIFVARVLQFVSSIRAPGIISAKVLAPVAIIGQGFPATNHSALLIWFCWFCSHRHRSQFCSACLVWSLAAASPTAGSAPIRECSRPWKPILPQRVRSSV
jgi:hypothetical protein